MMVPFTRPWKKGEYIHLNGIPMVYDWTLDEEMLVHFPGGKSGIVNILYKQYKIIPPTRMRRDKAINPKRFHK
jgi:hypothetical protein